MIGKIICFFAGHKAPKQMYIETKKNVYDKGCSRCNTPEGHPIIRKSLVESMSPPKGISRKSWLLSLDVKKRSIKEAINTGTYKK